MEIIEIHEHLFLSPDIDEWDSVHAREISVVIDLEGGLDHGVPVLPDYMMYIYLPIHDDGLPNLKKLHEVAKLGANLVKEGHKVLSHCGMGLNRSALVAALILMYLGKEGKEAVEILRDKRPGALFNDNFADYLLGLKV